MKPEQRQQLLVKIIAVCVGLVVLDYGVVEPIIHAWGEQSERIAALQKKVDRGQALVERAATIRGRWADMGRVNLPDDLAAASSVAYLALGRWTSTSGVSLPSFDPQWQTHEAGDYDTYECRASVAGSLPNLSRFIYELEADPAPVNLEECEIATRDAHGQQLTMSARFSFIHLGPDAGSVANNTAATPSRGRSNPASAAP